MLFDWSSSEIKDDSKPMLDELALLLSKYPLIDCTACDYCMPCPYGIDIPGSFSHYNKCVNEGSIAVSAMDENFADARRKFLIGYSRAVEPQRQADHCISCGKCAKRCPQQIFIPRQLRRINEYLEKLKQETL